MDLGEAIARVPDSLFRRPDSYVRPPLVADPDAALAQTLQLLDITRRRSYFSIGTGYERQPLVAALLGLDVIIADLDSRALAWQRQVAEQLGVRPTFIGGDILEPSQGLEPYEGRMGIVACLNSTHKEDFIDGVPSLMLSLVSNGGVIYANATGPFPVAYDKLVQGVFAAAVREHARVSVLATDVFTTAAFGNDAKILAVGKPEVVPTPPPTRMQKSVLVPSR